MSCTYPTKVSKKYGIKAKMPTTKGIKKVKHNIRSTMQTNKQTKQTSRKRIISFFFFYVQT